MVAEAGSLAGDGTPPRLVIHAGAPKCGSSAIQAALSARPVVKDRDGRSYGYLCASPQGALSGTALTARAARSPFGYEASANIRADESAAAVLRSAEQGAAQMIARGTVPILSSEGWIRRAPLFERDGLVARLGGEAHVVLYVRPPLDWLNAAWWQWGVWTDLGRMDWLRRNVSHARWVRYAREWAALPGVSAVHVRLADRDVVESFHTTFDLPGPDGEGAVNTSLPPPLMAFFLRNRDLRPGPHGAQIEFTLMRALRGTRPPPSAKLWAMTATESAALWSRIAFDEADLAPILPDADRARMEADQRWSCAAPYDGLTPTDLTDYESPEALTALHDWLAQAAGRPPARGPFASVAKADAAIRDQIARLTRGRFGLARLRRGAASVADAIRGRSPERERF